MTLSFFSKIFFSFLFIFFLISITVTSIVSTESHTLLFSPLSKTGKTIYVYWNSTNGNGSREHPYQHIWQAMNVAQDGDTVYVFNGSYLNEVLYINKSINFIGENRDTTLIVRDDAWTITIFANHVNISEFSMWVGKGGVMSNVKLRIRSDNCTVTDMKFIAPLTALCKGDIVLYGANFNTIKNNIYSDNVSGGFFPRIGPAIRLEHSCNNIIEDNTIHMFLSALVLQNSSNGNMIMNNTIHTGCLIDGSSNNMITRNNLSKIAITNSFNINITDNNFQEYTFKDWKLMGPQVDFTTSDIFLDHNYWGRSRLLPKVFFGHDGTKHVMEVDWHPAKEPNQIS